MRESNHSNAENHLYNDDNDIYYNEKNESYDN